MKDGNITIERKGNGMMERIVGDIVGDPLTSCGPGLLCFGGGLYGLSTRLCGVATFSGQGIASLVFMGVGGAITSCKIKQYGLECLQMLKGKQPAGQELTDILKDVSTSIKFTDRLDKLKELAQNLNQNTKDEILDAVKDKILDAVQALFSIIPGGSLSTTCQETKSDIDKLREILKMAGINSQDIKTLVERYQQRGNSGKHGAPSPVIIGASSSSSQPPSQMGMD